MQSPLPRILFIDAYDSFSNNIISLLETSLSCSVRTVKIDNPILLASESALRDELSHYDAVVCGPGPGHPAIDEDVGIIKNIWKLCDEDLLPVLGICLGFQSLCLEFGAKVVRLKGPQHGIVRRVTHVGENYTLGKNTIFEGVGELKATHYQSLCADIGQDAVKSSNWNASKWAKPATCSDLVPLAYAESDLSISNDSGIKDARVLVGVQHATKPFWALQYHPESICTEEESDKVFKNWFKHAQHWNQAHRSGRINVDSPQHGLSVVPDSLLSQHGEIILDEAIFGSGSRDLICHTHTIDFPSNVSVSELAEGIKYWSGEDRIIFESTNANEPEPFPGSTDVRGRYSIVAMRLDNSPILNYTVGNESVTVLHKSNEVKVLLKSGGIWPFISQYMATCQVTDGNPESPFWGGFMGYTTYELGLESIGVKSTKLKTSSRPDLCFAWVKESLVVDHVKNQLHIQFLDTREQAKEKIFANDIIGRVERFIQSRTPSYFGPTSSRYESTPVSTPLSTYPSHTNLHRPHPTSTPPLSRSSSPTNLQIPRATATPPLSASSSFTNLIHSQSTSQPAINSVISIKKPSDSSYESQVIQCQENISSGDSYELCLTDQTTIVRPKPLSPLPSWDLYKTLRARQPAPFASFIQLGGATLVSSSPERFLTWDENNHCSLRPMKGTVRKTAEVDTLAKAKALLDVPKEKAENLMIVDLVRHDLHGICGSGNVQVPRLCVVEEYKSVFQMISVVEGQIPAPSSGTEENRYTGIDVLAASLPPGSMTGAPKKRSCEILQGVEGQERGLYSGVVGYLDVRGRGDWSVTIRSMFKWEDEDEGVIVEGKEVECEKWHIGAGGAVTTLSTAVGEREEMATKLNGTLGIFL